MKFVSPFSTLMYFLFFSMVHVGAFIQKSNRSFSIPAPSKKNPLCYSLLTSPNLNIFPYQTFEFSLSLSLSLSIYLSLSTLLKN